MQLTATQLSKTPIVYCMAGILLLLSACGGPRPMRGDNQEARSRVVNTALSFRGTKYRYGGSSPAGFDCSGLVHYSHAKGAAIRVPRSSYKQYKASKPIYQRDLQPGDLVFFRTESSFVSHVGIYIGDGKFVHAPGTGKTVRVQSMDNGYYRKRFVGGGTFFK